METSIFKHNMSIILFIIFTNFEVSGVVHHHHKVVLTLLGKHRKLTIKTYDDDSDDFMSFAFLFVTCWDLILV